MKKRFRSDSEPKSTISPYAGLSPTEMLARKLDITHTNPTAGNIATDQRCTDCIFNDLCVRGSTECHQSLTIKDETTEFNKDLDLIILSNKFFRRVGH
jgi:hypothetical protein